MIPNLTYEQFIEFHRNYYHPANSYIYLYGDMDMVQKLTWLDEEYLCRYDRKDCYVDSSIPMQKAFALPGGKGDYLFCHRGGRYGRQDLSVREYGGWDGFRSGAEMWLFRYWNIP